MRNFGDKFDNTAPLPSGILSAEEDNVRFKELENIVSSAGIALDGPEGPDTDFTMLGQAAGRYASSIFMNDVGAANDYVLATPTTFVLPKAYFTGMIVQFYPAHTNTSPTCTANVGGLGAKAIYSLGGNLLVGDIAQDTLCELIYDAALAGGAGGFVCQKAGMLFRNVSGGVPIYQGRGGDGRHVFRTLEAGTNISFQLIETSAGSGDYRVRINGAAGGGGGGGSPHLNVGAGAQVHKTNDGTYDELRTLVPNGGISILQNADDIAIQLEPVTSYQFLVRNGVGAGIPAPVAVYELQEELHPVGTDELLLSKAGNAGLMKIRLDTILPGVTRPQLVAGCVAYTRVAGYTAALEYTLNVASVVNTTTNTGQYYGTLYNVAFSSQLADTNYMVQATIEVNGNPGDPNYPTIAVNANSRTRNGFSMWVNGGDGLTRITLSIFA